MIGIVAAKMFHARLRPRKNVFNYRATYLTITLQAFSPGRPCALLSIDRANLFSLRTRDYGDGVLPPAAWITRVLTEWNLPQADGDIELMTIPRVLGYAFNPVNFWFCFDRARGLRAVLAEVNNTFGERHCYICFHPDRRAIAASDVLTARKLFHVSPFIEVKGEYSFRFSNAPDGISVAIDLSDEEGVLLKTSVAGAVQPLTAARLVGALLANPLFPLKVALLIHYQAAKLFLKRVKHFRKPPAPAISISH